MARRRRAVGPLALGPQRLGRAASRLPGAWRRALRRAAPACAAGAPPGAQRWRGCPAVLHGVARTAPGDGRGAPAGGGGRAQACPAGLGHAVQPRSDGWWPARALHAGRGRPMQGCSCSGGTCPSATPMARGTPAPPCVTSQCTSRQAELLRASGSSTACGSREGWPQQGCVACAWPTADCWPEKGSRGRGGASCRKWC
jgi:hypothetical protein